MASHYEKLDAAAAALDAADERAREARKLAYSCPARLMAMQEIATASKAYVAAKDDRCDANFMRPVNSQGRFIKDTFDAVQAELETSLCRMEELGLVEGYGDQSGTVRQRWDAIFARAHACDRLDAFDGFGRWDEKARKAREKQRNRPADPNGDKPTGRYKTVDGLKYPIFEGDE